MGNAIDKHNDSGNFNEGCKNIPIYESFFKKNVLQINGKYAINNRHGRTCILIKFDNGVCLPFYRSANGTDGKKQGGWFAYFGVTQDNIYMPKGTSIEEMNNGYGSPKIKQMHEIINATLTYPHNYDIDNNLNAVLPFLCNESISFVENSYGPTSVPQGKNHYDGLALAEYQNAWINMIENTNDILYFHSTASNWIHQYVQKSTNKICANSSTLTNKQVREYILADVAFTKGDYDGPIRNITYNQNLILSPENQETILLKIIERCRGGDYLSIGGGTLIIKLSERADFSLKEKITNKGMQIIHDYKIKRENYFEQYNSEVDEEEENQILAFPIYIFLRAMSGLG